MPIAPLSDDDVARIAAAYRLPVTDQDLPSYRALAEALLTSYEQVERRYQASLAEPPVRSWERPADDDNPLGAWYVTTRIQTRDDGPLAGRQIAIKDNIEVAGVPMMNGSAVVEGFVPRQDATVVTRLLDAGAVITGKAVCEDLCFSGGSHTSVTGPVRNPWDNSRSAGGSSSGSAALVAAGHADLALGGDQGGSIRIPAAFCGVVGHKPTHGLVPYTGAFPIENTLDHLGPITSTVRDAALMLGVLAGPDGLDPRQRSVPASQAGHHYLAALDSGFEGMRIGVLQEGFGIPGLSQPDVDEAVMAAIETLASAGADVRDVSVPWHRDALHVWTVIATDGVVTQMIDGDGFGMNWPGWYDPDLMDHYRRGRGEHADRLPESVKPTILAGRHVMDNHGGRYYAMARNLAFDLVAAYDDALASFDVLVLPTLPITATPIPAPRVPREESIERSTEMIVNTAPFDVTGHPATSVPAGMVDGLPVGLMIVGPHFGDATCLRVAHAYEVAAGGFPAPPGAVSGEHALGAVIA
jgi:amidase